MSKPKQKPIRVAIVGSRHFKPTIEATRFIDRCLAQCDLNQIEIVSGGAHGADRYGVRYAEARQLPFKLFPADWGRNGQKAGYMRNREMGNYVTHVIALWDGQSRSTQHMIRLAQRMGLHVRVWNTRYGKHDRTYFH